MGQQARYSAMNEAPRAIVIQTKRGYRVATVNIACQHNDSGDVVLIYTYISRVQGKKTALGAARSLLNAPPIHATANGEDE